MNDSTASATARQVMITANLYKARDAAKFMLGPKYQEGIQPMVTLLRDTAKRRNVPEIVAASDLAKELAEHVSGQAAVMMLAALVESIEPSAP